MNKTDIDFSNEFLPDDDVALLESLIRSPAFGALKRTLEKYRQGCYSALLNASDVHKMYQTQGRIIGLQAIENLPAVLVAQRQAKLRVEEKKKKPERLKT